MPVRTVHDSILSDFEHSFRARDPAQMLHRNFPERLNLGIGHFGHEVWVARTGPDGVRQARALRPDVILCDIGLPGLDGFGVAAALRQDPATAGAHLVAITGYGSDQVRCRCREVGFDRYFTKPVDPEVLVRLIHAGPPP